MPPRVSAQLPSVSYRVLCETVKDFVARVGKAYEKTTESSQESEVMAKKVGSWTQGRWAAGAEELAFHATFPPI